MLCTSSNEIMETQLIKESKKDINIGLSKESRQGVIEILNRNLCDEYILYTKTRNYHWNVVGPHFNDRHKFLQEQYEILDEIIDEIAERVRTINGRSLGSLSEFLEYGRVKENPGQYQDDMTMISNLLADHEQIIRNLRTEVDKCDKEYHDMGTNDFLIGVMEKHEKMAWMLRAHLDGSQ
jgi:starvation-inducible DNA-binding protein